MTIENDRNLIEHTIKIDEYTEIRIKIPEILDSIEFSSILEKSRKLLKLSEVSVITGKSKNLRISGKKYVTDSNLKKQIVYDYKKTKSREERVELMRKYGYTNYESFTKAVSRFKQYLRDNKIEKELTKKDIRHLNNKEDQKNIVEQYNQCKTVQQKEELSKSLGLTLTQLYARVSYYKKQHNIVTKSSLTHGKKVSTWKNGKEKKLIDLYNQGISSSEISERLGLRKKQVYDKLFYLVSKKKIKKRKIVQPVRNHVKTTPLQRYSDKLVEKVVNLVKQKKDINEISRILVQEDNIKDMTTKKVYDLIFNRTGKRVSEIREEMNNG